MQFWVNFKLLVGSTKLSLNVIQLRAREKWQETQSHSAVIVVALSALAGMLSVRLSDNLTYPWGGIRRKRNRLLKQYDV